jgi:ribosomal protein S12 methylthiotransferase accessory factor
VLYNAEQYGAIPYVPYREATTIGWIPGTSLANGGKVYVPALACLMAYEPASPEELLFPYMEGGGVAAGPTSADAVLSAALEVIERDAFMITWFNRLPASRVPLSTYPDGDVIEFCKSYDRAGIAIELYRLPTDTPVVVFLALIVDDRGRPGTPPVAVGLGAGLEPAHTARRAILEAAMSRFGRGEQLKERGLHKRIREIAEDHRLVADHLDHRLLYSNPDLIGAFDFLRKAPTEELAWGEITLEEDPSSRLGRLVDHFMGAGNDVIAVDLTTDDMRAHGLHVARTIIPGFQPLHFGYATPRLGGRRVFEVPRNLGMRSEPSSPEELNYLPQPLA